MTGNATTGGGGDLQGTLREAMEAGVAMGAQYLQVYGDDVANPATPKISRRSPLSFFHRQTTHRPQPHSKETTSSLRKTELVQEGQLPLSVTELPATGIMRVIVMQVPAG